MFVRHTKLNNFDDLTLYELREFFDLFEAKEIIYDIDQIIYIILNDLRKTVSFTQTTIYRTIKVLDHVINENIECDKEKFRSNLIKYMTTDVDFYDKLNFVRLIVNGYYYYVISADDCQSVEKYFDREEEYYIVTDKENNEKVVKYCGLGKWKTVSNNSLINSYILTRYRNKILRLETIYYFMIVNQLTIEINDDIVFVIKQFLI